MQVISQEATSRGPRLLEHLLADQARTTAVEKFAQWHAEEAPPLGEKHYRDLLPLSRPQEGEQYAFEVDLDACSGCKSCVAACHNLNGLEEDELWRSVGLLHGGAKDLPVLQHVTTACHHCIEPACLEGCPVLAYEKDPATGIVHHLDDQCIGCQYCILKCPYDVPQYSPRKGIVRKCDMCSGRLAVGEAPACVEACPTQAIRIAIVNRQAIIDESEANHFLPGSPEPSYTLPTTVYKTGKPLPRNLLPADYYTASPQHAHLPLVLMLVLTQMSVGAFVAQWGLALASETDGPLATGARPAHLAAALALGLVGMAASILHLGRPLYAFRALLGLRTSWLSREILAFSLFAVLTAAYAGVAWLDSFQEPHRLLHIILGGAAALGGVAGVACSVMIYVDTRRAYWGPATTGLKFFSTVVLLGLPAALLVSLAGAAWSTDVMVQEVMARHGRTFCHALVAASCVKLLTECLVFTSLRRKQYTPLKRTALLMTGVLGTHTKMRFLCGVAGGIVLPGILAASRVAGAPAAIALVAASMALLVAGEFLERYLFFRAAVALKMPGGLAS